MASNWSDLIRSLGEAFAVLVSSEIDVLKQELAESRRRLVAAVLIGILALFVLFWSIGAAMMLGFEALATVVARWLAALIVLLVLASVAAVLGAIARTRLKSLESPLTTAQRRWSDHLEWWQKDVLESHSVERTLAAGEQAEGAGDGRSSPN